MILRVAKRVATAHIHGGADRLSPSDNTQFFEPHGSRHAQSRRKHATIHIHRLETQRPRFQSSILRNLSLLDYAGLPLAYIGNVSRTTASGRVRCYCEAFSIRR
jgi:hypothetical protein